MGSPISPIVANLYMEDLETKAIQTAPPPMFWKRFVDDTFVIIMASHKQEFLDHINSIDQHIQFASEESREDGSMPFSDMLIIPQDGGRFNTTIYRKPTTDMYLQWDSQQPISSKYSIVGTLHHRAKTVCSDSSLQTSRRRTPSQNADKMQISYLGSKQSKDENEIHHAEEKQKPKQEH